MPPEWLTLPMGSCALTDALLALRVDPAAAAWSLAGLPEPAVPSCLRSAQTQRASVQPARGLLVSYRPLGHADLIFLKRGSPESRLPGKARAGRPRVSAANNNQIHAELIPGERIFLGLLRFRIHQKAPRSALCRRGLAQGPVRLARRARLVPLAARGEALELHAVARSPAAIRAGRLV